MNDKKFIRIKVIKSLRKLLGRKHLNCYELLRINNLGTMISSILITKRSEIRQMALGHPDRKKYGSKIKQFKRILQNPYIDYKSYYLSYACSLLHKLSKIGDLKFSIDGSSVGRGCMCLMFSVLYKEKAIPIIWHVYKAKKGHLPEQAHRNLLSELSQIVPCGCRVIITGDGEFDGCDWQTDILKQGWDYVLRTGKNVQIREAGWDEFKPRTVCLCSGNQLFFEEVEFTRKRLLTNLLIWHGRGHKKPIYLVSERKLITH